MTLITEEMQDCGFIYLVPKVECDFGDSEFQHHIQMFVVNACKGLGFNMPTKEDIKDLTMRFYDKFEDELLGLFLEDPCNSNDAEYLFDLLKDHEHEVITSCERHVWLAMQKIDMSQTSTLERLP